MASPVAFISSQYATIPSLGDHDLSGQTIVVTGANAGLGLECARYLAGMKPGKLIMTARNASKGAEALESVKASTGCETVVCWNLDLADFESVKEFVQRLESEGGRLDLLLCNAGVSTDTFSKSAAGYESTIQVNVLSTFLLSLLSAPLLLKTAKTKGQPTRCVIVTSEVHHWIPTLPSHETEYLKVMSDEKRVAAAPTSTDKAEKQLAMSSRYPMSKLLEVLFVTELAKHLPKEVSFSLANPGLCHSGLTREASGMKRIFISIMKLLLARPTEVGSRCLLHPALIVSPQEGNGKYFSTFRSEPTSVYCQSSEGQEASVKVYKEVMEILKKVDKRVDSILVK